MDEFRRAQMIEDHIKECQHRIEIINRYMQTAPDASKEECIQNIQSLETVISALQELQQYRTTGLTPRMVEELKENDKRSHKLAVQRAAELDEYRAIGTVEECRAALERQQAKKPSEQSCAEKTHYKCPDCGYVLQTVYADGYRLGNQTKFCEMCGQAIDWSEV